MTINGAMAEALAKILQQLAAGEFDVDLQTALPVQDNQEAEAVRQALEALQARLQSLSATIDYVAAGNLPATSQAVSEKDRLGLGIEKMLGHLRCTIAQVDAGAEALASSEAQLSDTSNDTSAAVQEIVAAFGNVTAQTFSQLSAINKVNQALGKLSDLPADAQKTIEGIKQEISTINNAAQENAKVTVGLRLTTNKMLDQVDQVVVTSRGLRGMTLGLQGTLAPYIIRSKEQQDKVLKLAYLPIADHLVLPLTYLRQLGQPDGLPLQPMRCNAWPQLLTLLENDKADGALILAPLAIKAHLDELPVKTIMAVHRNGSGLILHNSIEGMDDIPGRVIAVPHRYSTHNVLLYKALQQNDIPYGAVEVKWAPPPLMPYFLQRGTLDGFVSAEPFPEVALDIGAGKMAFYSKDIMPNHMCCVLLMREEALARSPEAIIRLVKSFVEINKQISQNPAQAAQDVAPFFGVAPAIMERVLTSPPDRITYDDLRLNKDEFIDFGTAMIDMGILEDLPDVDSLVDERYFEAAMA